MTKKKKKTKEIHDNAKFINLFTSNKIYIYQLCDNQSISINHKHETPMIINTKHYY